MTGQVLDFNKAQRQGEHQSERFDADQTRAAITARAPAFVEWLFPCAVIHRSGKFAAIGDIYGQPGESLHIELTGPKAGYWKDFAASEDRGKDLIGLFMASNDMASSEFGKALELINTEFLNESRPVWTRAFTQHLQERAKKYDGMPRPSINDRPAPTEAYVYRDAHGGVIGVVRRHELDTLDPETGKPKKTFSVWDAVASKAQAPMPRPLYRIPEIIRVNDIVFVEGERKADALASVGIEATCIMFGSDAPLDKVDWTPISGKRVRIWPDKDSAGSAFANRLAPMLAALGCEVTVVEPPADKPNKWDAADCVAEGGDPVAILRAASKAAPTTSPDTFKLYTLEELENLPPPEWLVDRVMVSNGLVLLWAGSDNYKTFVAIDLAMHVASGSAWQGHEVKAGPVVYVAAEDETGVAIRMIGWRRTKGRELPRPDVTLLRDGFTMASPDADKLIRSIKALPAKPRLVVIDTVARTFGAGNEDKTSDMNAFVLGMDKIRRETGATVMVVHHTGRNTEQERGNVALRGACDTIFTVKRAGKDRKIKLINTPPKGKQKNAEPFPDIALRLQEVAFPYLESERTTLVVMSDDGAPAAGEPLEDDEAEDTAPRLGQIEKSIMVALDKAARSNRKHLGFISLHATVGGDKGNFGRSLRKLVEKRLITETPDDADPEKKRRNYALATRD